MVKKDNLVLLFGLGLAALIFVSGFFILTKTKSPKQKTEVLKGGEAKMRILSSAFLNNQEIPKKHTCDGENVNPPLTIAETPTNAKSLVLIVDDPDAPTGTWVHWVVFNIDAKTKEIAENSVPTGAILGKNDFGKLAYGGSCPPSGTHRYFFKLYALDTILSLPEGVTKAEVEKTMKEHVLDRGELIGLYKRG
jgi:Raf kinase inhibitor-like YbhB/YbcL family protein